MATIVQSLPVLETLARRCARRRGDDRGAQWLVHAWRSLASSGYVPEPIPTAGPAAVEARVRLGVLVRLRGAFEDLGPMRGREPFRLDEGPDAVDPAEVLGWMRSRDIPRQPDLWDPSGSGLTDADVEACLDRLERETLAALVVVLGFDQLLAELLAQRGDAPTGADAGPLYPLTPARADALLARTDEDARLARAWLERAVPHIRR